MIIGITAEWNPFHLGHAYMVEHLKREYPDTRLLAVMSGPFVQRGEPALFDKWARASWAVQAGVDAVLELPGIFIPCTARILPLAQNPQRSRNCRKRPDGLPVMNTCQYFTPF